MRILGLAVTLLSFVGTALAQCEPKEAVRIVTANVSPALPKEHYARRPKTVYRLGSTYARMEEELDPENQIQGLIVVSAPDSWIVNLVDRTGQHVVDPDPAPRVRAPILPLNALPTSLPEEFAELEFGCEVQFFDERNSPLTSLGKTRPEMVKQVYGRGKWLLALARKEGEDIPRTLVLLEGGEVVFALKYLQYYRFSEPPMALFKRPENVRFAEAEPPA